MSFPIILAHGSLGAFDEVIFLGVGVIFLGMMGLSWLRSRNEADLPEEAEPTVENPDEQDAPERFRLD